MKFNSYRFRVAFLDANKLRKSGVSWNSILRMVTLSIPLVKDSLSIILCDGTGEDSCNEALGYVEIIYMAVASAISKQKHHNLVCNVVFNNKPAIRESTELIPEGMRADLCVNENHFVVPGTRAVPLLMYVPKPVETFKYDSVLFAGTFDHLHPGHRSVLTMAFFLARRKLYIGVTSDSLLRNKKYFNGLQPFETRALHVSDFIATIRPSNADDIEVVLLETEDAVGPAGTLEFDAIVVTP